jgi:hypothetical protein
LLVAFDAESSALKADTAVAQKSKSAPTRALSQWTAFAFDRSDLSINCSSIFRAIAIGRSPAIVAILSCESRCYKGLRFGLSPVFRVDSRSKRAAEPPHCICYHPKIPLLL